MPREICLPSVVSLLRVVIAMRIRQGIVLLAPCSKEQVDTAHMRGASEIPLNGSSHLTAILLAQCIAFGRVKAFIHALILRSSLVTLSAEWDSNGGCHITQGLTTAQF